MRKVIGIGETVLDIIFQGEQPVSAVPGGSTFNAMISLGRAGVEATFISETGNDRVGQRIISFLEENHVDASNVNVYPDSKSPLSLAFLNEQNDAEYIFYKDHPKDRLDFKYPTVNEDDIVVFGSYYALNPVIRPQVLGFLQYAHQHGAILYYDVNFRSSHKHEVMKLTANFLENLELADVVRGSHEDFDVMFNTTDAEKVYCLLLQEVHLHTRQRATDGHGRGWIQEGICRTVRGDSEHNRCRRQLQCRFRLWNHEAWCHAQHDRERTTRRTMGCPGSMCPNVLCRMLQEHQQLCLRGIWQ